jgi:hypothetical protein
MTLTNDSETHPIFDAWMADLAKEPGLVPNDEATRSQLLGWLQLMLRSVGGSDPDREDLEGLVALEARAQGADGQQVERLIRWLQTLETVASTHKCEQVAELVHALIPLAADAYAMGRVDRAEKRHRHLLRKASPVVRIGEKAVLAFLLGPTDDDVLDAILGRLFTETVRARAPIAILDVSGADTETPLFHRTLFGFGQTKENYPFSLAITGLPDPKATHETLEQLGCALEHVRILGPLGPVLSDLESLSTYA